MPIQTVSFRTDSTKVAALDALATAERRDRTHLLNEAIDHYLEFQRQRDQEILEALADVDAGLTIPHEDVKPWLDSLVSGNPLPAPTARKK